MSSSYYVDSQQTLPDFASFVRGFLDPDCYIRAEKKDELPLFMAAEYASAGVRRCAANVLRVGFAIYDIDKGTWDDLYPSLAKAQEVGYVIYTSFSHGPEQLKVRLIVKLKRPVEIHEWSSFWIRSAVHMGLHEIVDKKCADPCHMFFTPGGNNPEAYQVDGADGPGMDVDAVLALDLPANIVAPVIDHQVVLDEEERGEIGQGLKEVWRGQLDNLAAEIRKRPYPGEIYDLKSHGVYGIARGVPHIVSEDRVRNIVRAALSHRYRKHAGDADPAAIDAQRDTSFEQVDIAIGEGQNSPWYPPATEDVERLPLTEFGLSERLLAEHEEDLSFEYKWKKWLVWNDQFWNLEGGDSLVAQRMKASIRAIPEEADAFHAERWIAKEAFEEAAKDPDIDEGVKSQLEYELKGLEGQIESIHKFALGCETNKKRNSGISLASDESSVMVSHKKFNANKWLINFRNGTLDLQTGRLRPHARGDFITRMLPFSFNPDAKCPRFDKLLSDCMLGRKSLVDFLWRLLGYTATGFTSEQMLILMVGDGENGKTTFVETILAAFGNEDGYGFVANSENLLTNKGGSRHETWRMSLFGKRLVSCEEVDEGRNLNESLIKELTGGNRITGRRMREDEWSFAAEFQLWVSTNHLPHIRGVDEGIWRRMKVVPWDASFPKGAPSTDGNLKEKLLQEICGIWARIALEAAAWAKDGLTFPQEVEEATAAFRREEDPLRPFLEAWCAYEASAFVLKKELWGAYDTYCQDAPRNQVFHVSKRFHAAMAKNKQLKASHKREGALGYLGMRIMTSEERMAANPRAQFLKSQTSANKSAPN